MCKSDYPHNEISLLSVALERYNEAAQLAAKHHIDMPVVVVQTAHRRLVESMQDMAATAKVSEGLLIPAYAITSERGWYSYSIFMSCVGSCL